MTNLLIIDDSTVRSLLQDPRALDLLPCLKQVKTELGSIAGGNAGCGGCMKTRQQRSQAAIASAKSCIGRTRVAALASLKSLLGAKQLRLIVTSNGQRTQYTI